MINKLRSLLLTNRNWLISILVASIGLTLIVLVPSIGQSVAVGLLVIPLAGALLYSISFNILVGLVAVLFGSAVALVFYLLRIKHSLFVSSIGLALGYVFFSWLNQVVDLPVYLKALIFFVAACTLFYGLMRVGERLKIKRPISFVLFFVLLGSCVYAAQLVERVVIRPEAIQAYVAKENQEFETAKQSINFTIYYPTYSSAELPASDPKLNGYSQDQKKYTNPHVTFKLGGALVTQTGLLKDQDKIMDFTRNCDIMRLAQAMGSSSEVSQRLIDRSLENLSRCKVIHQTSTGKSVLFRENGQWTTFYLQDENTNIVIEFDDINSSKYTEALLPEIKKTIDSLRPITLEKVQRGKKMLADRY
jgi:hypothetical protein